MRTGQLRARFTAEAGALRRHLDVLDPRGRRPRNAGHVQQRATSSPTGSSPPRSPRRRSTCCARTTTRCRASHSPSGRRSTRPARQGRHRPAHRLPGARDVHVDGGIRRHSRSDRLPHDDPLRPIGNFVGFIQLELSKNPNPRMSDGDPPWLSIDLRVFKTNPGDTPTAEIEHPDDGADGAYAYIQDVLDGLQRLGWRRPSLRRPAHRPGRQPARAGHQRRRRQPRLQLRHRPRALPRSRGRRCRRRAGLLPHVDDGMDGAGVRRQRQLPEDGQRAVGDPAARVARRRDQQRAVLRRAACGDMEMQTDTTTAAPCRATARPRCTPTSAAGSTSTRTSTASQTTRRTTARSRRRRAGS